MIRRHVETLDPAILLGLPGQLVVAPVLLHPQVGRHDLVLQILKSVWKHFTRINISNEIACQSQNMDSNIKEEIASFTSAGDTDWMIYLKSFGIIY